jgi:hypothetical protein
MKTLTIDGEDSFNLDLVPYKKLWFAVLQQAIGDALNDTSSEITKAYAVDFFLDKTDGVGTFYWICDFIDMNPEYVLKNVRRLYMKNIENKERIERTIIKDKKKRDMIEQGLGKLVVDEKDRIKFVFTEKYKRIQNKLKRETKKMEKKND